MSSLGLQSLAQAPGKSIFSLQDSFHFYLMQNKSQPAGLQLLCRKTNAMQAPLAPLVAPWLFMSTDQSSLIDRHGRVDGRTSAGDICDERRGAPVL